MSLFVVYRYRANRPVPYGSNAEDDASVSAALSDVATSNGDFSLSVVAMNLEIEIEQMVRGALAKRLSRGCVYNGSGNIVTLGSQIPGAPEDVCYYCLLRANDEEVQIEPGTGSAENESNVCSSDFVVCCIRTGTAGEELDMFRSELDHYCKQLLKDQMLLRSLENDEMMKAMTSLLGQWYEDAVGYLARCVQFFGERLDVVLQAGLVGQKVEVIGQHVERKRDLVAFVKSLSLASLLSYQSDNVPADYTDRLDRLRTTFPTVTITLSDDGSSFSCTTTGTANDFCTEWAKDMLAVKRDPIELKRVMHRYELCIIQDINTLKRILCQAETNHYALFTAYSALKGCATLPTLVLASLVNTIGEATRDETRDVVETLLEYVELQDSKTALQVAGN